LLVCGERSSLHAPLLLSESRGVISRAFSSKSPSNSMSFQNFRLQATPSQPPVPPSAHDNVTPGSLLHSIPLAVHQQAPAPHPVVQTNQPDPSGSHHHGPTAAVQSADLKDSNSRVPGKAPYGSGDAEDGYTLVFESMQVRKIKFGDCFLCGQD